MEYHGSFGGHEKHNRMTKLILAAMIAKALGIEVDDETMYRQCMCEFCAKGVPLVNGKHILLGAEIPCDAMAK